MKKLKQFDYKGYSISGFTYTTNKGLEVFEDDIYYTLRYGDEWLEVRDGNILWLGWQTYEDFGLATESNLKNVLSAVKEVEEYILDSIDNDNE